MLAGQRHAELILDSIGTLLGELHLSVGDLDAIAYGSGPGSFTGLRIGCGVAQGLALANGLRVLGVSTLLALAEECGEPKVQACINARMGEVYHAAYRRNGPAWEEICAPALCKPELLPLPADAGWTGCGNGFLVHGPVLRARLGQLLVQERAEAVPTAAAVLRLARPVLESGQGQAPEHALPLYVRDKVALTTAERK